MQYPYGIFPCKDGYVDIAGGLLLLDRVERLLGMPLQEKYGGANQFNTERREEFLSNIWYPWLMERTKREIIEACQKAHPFSGPINTTEDLLQDPHFIERGFWVDIDHPVVGKVTYPGSPAKASEMPWLIRRPAPLLGEHNEDVYSRLGYTKEDLVKMREGGVI